MSIIINNTTTIKTQRRHFVSVTQQYVSIDTITLWLTNIANYGPILKAAQLCGYTDDLTLYLDTMPDKEKLVLEILKRDLKKC